MITLYYDSNLRLQGPTYQVFPLLEELEKANSQLHSVYKLIGSLNDCDYAMIPMSLQYLYVKGFKTRVHAFLEQCEKASKAVLVFSGGDYGMKPPSTNCISIRLGGKASSFNHKTYIMPPFINDPFDWAGAEEPMKKPLQPTVGFVGHSDGSTIKYIKELASYLKGNFGRMLGVDSTEIQSFYPSSIKRFQYLKKLENDQRVVSNFIHRRKYRAGASYESDRTRTQMEFYENIRKNLYTFCLRGTGNFSVRFYETLAMGRIPLLINTDCELPFRDEISWQEHAVIVNESEIKNMVRILVEFHQGISEEKCHALQQKNRLL